MNTPKEIIAQLKREERDFEQPRYDTSRCGHLRRRGNIYEHCQFFCHSGRYDVYIDPNNPELAGDWLLVEGDNRDNYNGNKLSHEEQDRIKGLIELRLNK